MEQYGHDSNGQGTGLVYSAKERGGMG